MKIRINGELKEVEKPINLSELLEKLNVQKKGIAVELNQAVVPKDSWPSIHVDEGDTVEIVQFVGGGV